MAYSVKYLFKFASAAGTTREIRVLKDGYSGEVIQRPLGRAPMLKKQQNGPVHGTSLEFYAECNVDREFIEFYTSDPKDYRVDLYAGSTLLWQGYITPELYSEPDIAPPYDVQVVATDGLGELKLYDYVPQGTVTLRAMLTYLLGYTGLSTDVFLISSLKPGSAGAGSLLEKTINLDYMAGQTCYEVLTYILDTLHATITWWKGAWILTRETNVTFTSGKVRYFNTAGNSALLTDSVQALGKMRVNPVWPVGQLSTVIDPAKNKVTVQAPWHTVTCLQNPEMTSDTAWAKYNSAAYNTGTGGYYFPYPLSGTPQLRQQVSMAGIRVPLTLSVRATAATAAAGQGASAEIGVALIYTVGGTSYHLRKGTDGGLEWLAGSDVPSGAIPPRGAPVDFTQALAMWDAGRIEAEELKIENIPAFMQNGAFPAGTLTVYILGYCATVYGAYLDVVLPKGYQDILRLDNGARGEGSTVEIAIGRETADNAYYAAFLQGLLLDSGNLITSFSDANFTTGMDYLAFIARDYALSVALPRAKVTGTVFLESSVQIPPLVFTKGLLDYWLETFAWNLYEDELEIEARTLPSASLTVESETILESDGSTVSSSSGSGGSASSPMGGGGSNYFEPNEDLQTLIQLKSNYEYLGARDGLLFTGGDTSTPLPDLYVDVIQDAGGNNVRVLRSPLPLITGGDQIVTSGTPGQGGGGGGGAEFLYQLSDVYGSTSVLRPDGTDRVAGDALVFVGGSLNKWAAKTLVASVAGLSGDVTVAQIASALTSAGYALTDTIYTLPVATSDALGGIKIGYTQSGKNYPVQISSQKAYVNVPWTDVSFGTAGSDYVPVTIGNTTKNVLTAHQTVTLTSGTNNGTLKLTTAAGTVDNIAVKGLGSIAYKATSDYLAYSTERASSTNAIDLNDYTSSTDGEMKLVSWDNAGAQYAANRPVTSSRAASLYVLPNRWGGMQLYVDYNSSVYYLRNKYNDWTSWVQLYHSGNSNKTDVDWTCANLGASGVASLAHGLYIPSNTSGYGIALYGSDVSTYGIRMGQTATYGTYGGVTGNWAMYFNMLGGSASDPRGFIWNTVAGSVMALNRTGELTTAGHIKSGGYLYSDASSDARVYGKGSIILRYTPGSGLLLGSGTYESEATILYGTPLRFYTYNGTSGAERMRILANGNVGIGSTNPSALLYVNGTTYLNGDTTIPSGKSLQIGDAVISWNTNGYLEISKPLVTNGDQIVISGTPGGGGGGGATTLAGLDDTNIPDGFNTTGAVLFYNGSKWAPSTISSLATNDLLQWNGTTWANVAASSVGRIYSAGTGISISNANAISLSATYAGGTAVTLNGVSKAANTASFYAPTAGGTANKVLIGKGTTSAPDWSAFKITGTADATYNLANFLTGNQTITLSGDVSGSGTTSINVSIGSGKVTNAMLAGSIAWSKLSVSASDLTSLIGSSTYAPYNANGYLPLNGGTLTGEVELSHALANAASIKYTNKRATTSAGNWGDIILNIADADGTAMSRMGIYGSQNNLSYLYIGSNAASGVNLRISSTALTWGDNTIWHAGNFVAGTNYQAPMSQGTGITISNNQISVTANTYAPYNANGYLPLNGGTLSGLLLLNYANARIAFQDGSGTTLGALGVRSANTLEFYDTAWRTVWHANNSNLSTVDWTTKMLNVNGRLYMKGGNAIEFDNASGTTRGILSANDSKELLWHDGSWRTVYHSNNANKSDVAWTCSTLTIHSDTTSHGNIYLDNGKYIVGMLADGTTTANLLGLSNTDQLLIGYGMRSTGITAIYGQTMYFRSAATVGPEIYFGCSTHNKDAATLYFHSHPGSIRNGIKIGAEYAASADRLNLVVYTSNVGASPYTPSWSPTLKVTYTGRVGIGLSAPSEKLHVDGNILSTGDQVVSSDLTKKTNLVPIDLKVEQIAGAPAVTFDWKTGGHSFGSIAQYWKDVLGEAVLGTEGNYALAYGQLALVNTIVEAREIDKLKARVAELEAEVKRLTEN